MESLQFLQRAQHIGKVVLKVPHRMKLSPEASYVLSGGMGALGLITAQALAEEGAKSLLLLSRSGRPGSEVEQQWKWLQQSSLQATALACDVASAAGAADLKKRLKSAEPTGRGKKPVRGLLHLAGAGCSAVLSFACEKWILEGLPRHLALRCVLRSWMAPCFLS